MPVKLLLGFLVSMIMVLIIMPAFIKFLKQQSLRQSVSEYALPEDQKKAGTPIMGGILFIIVPVIVTLLTSREARGDLDIWIVILAFVGYGIIGFIDDYLIAIKKNNDGLKASHKLGLQILLAVVFFFLYRSHARLEVIIPFTDHVIHLGWWYFLLILFMFAGASNAVNLTDGMDGLAAGVSFIAFIPYLVFAFLQARDGLQMFIITLMGALAGYLYYNKKPAKVFMGDSGALALGGALAACAMVTKTELLLILIAGVPVLETLSVILQVLAVKTIHRRIFSYTPIHYAFRLRGMAEQNIVKMFWIAEAVMAALGLWVGLH